MGLARTGGCKMDGTTEGWRRLGVADVEIEFMERGAGEAIFLAHAGVFSEWFAPLYANPLLDGFRLTRMRRAGYGSIQPARHLTLADHAQHAGALADHLGVTRLHWVGHSMSCQIGLFLALQRPQLVGSLVLLEPAAGGGGFDVPASYDRPEFIGPALAAFRRGDVSAAFDAFMLGVCGDGFRELIEARLGKAGLELAIRESAFFFRDEIPAVIEARLGPAEAARIRQPVLCLEGGAQPAHLQVMARQVSQRAVELMPQTEIVVIEGANHALPLQNPNAIAAAIASFVRQVSAGITQ